MLGIVSGCADAVNPLPKIKLIEHLGNGEDYTAPTTVEIGIVEEAAKEMPEPPMPAAEAGFGAGADADLGDGDFGGGDFGDEGSDDEDAWGDDDDDFGGGEDDFGGGEDPFGGEGEGAAEEQKKVIRGRSHLALGRYTLPLSPAVPLDPGKQITCESLNVPTFTIYTEPESRSNAWFICGLIVSLALGLGWALKWRHGQMCRLSLLLLTMAVASAIAGLWIPAWADCANGIFAGVCAAAVLFILVAIISRGRRAIAARLGVLALLTALLLSPAVHAGGPPRAKAAPGKSAAAPSKLPARPRIIIPYSGDPATADAARKVVIPYRYYVKLWNEAHPDKRVRIHTPDTQIEISKVTYTATLDGREMALTLAATLKTRGRQMIRLPLPFDGFALTDASFDGQPAKLQAHNGGALLLLPPNRQGSLTLTGRATPTVKGRQGELNLRLPPLPMAVMQLQLPDRDLEVEVPGVTGVISSRPMQTGSRWTIPLGDMTKVALRWSPKVGAGAADRTLTAKASHQVYAFHWGVVGVSRLEYAFSAGEHDRFEFLLPTDIELTQITGANLRDYRVTDPQMIDGQQFRAVGIRLHRPAKQSFSLTVRWLGGLPELDRSASLRLPRAGQVGRESGNVQVYAAGEMAVKITSVTGGRRATTTATRKAAEHNKKPSRADLTRPVSAYYWPYRPFAMKWQLTRQKTEPKYRLNQLIRISTDQVEASTDAHLEAVNGQLFGAGFRLPDGYEVLSANGANVEDWYIQETENSRLLHVAFRRAVRKTRVAIVLIKEQAAQERLDVPILRAINADGRSIAGQSGELAVQVAPAFNARTIDSRVLKSLPPARLLPWLLQQQQVEAVQFAYAYEGAEASLTLGIRRLPAQVRSELFTGITVHPTAAVYTCRLRYFIQGSAIDRVTFSMPKAYASLVDVSSKSMRSVEEADIADDRHQWTVLLLNEVTGTQDIAVNFSLPIDSKTSELPIPRIETRSDAGYRSIIAVQNASRHEVDFVPSEELRPLPLEEQQDILRPELRNRLQYVYQSFRPEWTADLQVKPAKPARRLDAIIDLMALRSIIDRNGELRYEVDLSLQNRTEQFLHLKLPDDSTIWSATVADQQVKPVTDADIAGVVLIPLVKTSAHGLPYQVHLVIAGKTGTRIRGITRVRPPTLAVTNIPVKRTTWTLLMPDNFSYTWAKGNMSRATGAVELMTFSTEAKLSQLDRLAKQYTGSQYAGTRQQKAAAGNLKQVGRDVLRELEYNRRLLEQRRTGMDAEKYRRLRDKLENQDQSQQGVIRQLQQSERQRVAGDVNINRLLNSVPNTGVAETTRNAVLNSIPKFVALAQSGQLKNIRSELRGNVEAQKDMSQSQSRLAQEQEQTDLFAEADKKRQLGKIAEKLADEQSQRLSQRQQDLQEQLTNIRSSRVGRYYGRKQNEAASMELLQAELQQQAQQKRQQRMAEIEWKWIDNHPPAEPEPAAQLSVGRYGSRSQTARQTGAANAPVKPGRQQAANADMRKKLQNITIPKISFIDTPVSTVFDFLKIRSRELDPEGVGVNFLLILRPAGGEAANAEDPFAGEEEDPFGENAEDPFAADMNVEPPDQNVRQEPTITLDFDNIPLGEAIRYICEGAQLKYKVEEHAIVILGPGVNRETLELRFFSVDPNLLPIDDNFALQKFFEDMGLTFPQMSTGESTSISYDPHTNKLIVRNTPENLRLIETLLSPLSISRHESTASFAFGGSTGGGGGRRETNAPDTTAFDSLGAGTYTLEMSQQTTNAPQNYQRLDFYYPGPDAELSILAVPERHTQVIKGTLAILIALTLAFALRWTHRRFKAKT